MGLTGDDWQAIRLTLLVSAIAVGGAAGPGIALAVLLARRRSNARFLLDSMIYLPLVLPPVVIGWLLLELFGVRGLLGAPLHRWFGLQLAFTTAGASFACAVMILPLIVRSTRLSIEAIDPLVHQAARSLGAGAWDRFATITLPLAAPGLLIGLISAFAASLGEFGAVITFAANIPGQTRTLPLAIYTALQAPGGEAAAARLSLVSLALALTALTAAEWAARRLGWEGKARGSAPGPRWGQRTPDPIREGQAAPHEWGLGSVVREHAFRRDDPNGVRGQRP